MEGGRIRNISKKKANEHKKKRHVWNISKRKITMFAFGTQPKSYTQGNKQ